MEYLADTVALVRHFSKSGKMGKSARQILKDTDRGENIIYISIISMVEIMYLSEGNRIGIDLEAIGNRINQSDNYQIIDLNMDIVDTASAPEMKELELHDRLIVATAKYLNIPILTTDAIIKNSDLIEVIWK